MKFILKIDEFSKNYFIIRFNRNYIHPYPLEHMIYTDNLFFHRNHIGGYIRSQPVVEKNLCRRMEKWLWN